MKKAELKERVAELESELADLQIRHDSLTQSYKYANDGRSNAELAIEEMHQMFDGLENCPREVDDKRDYCSGKVKLSLSARFARYLQTLVVHSRF